MIILSVISIILIITSIFLFIRGINLVKRTEMLEDILVEYDVREDETKKVLAMMLDQMKEIDIRGSFESDDEVGGVFKQLKDLIEMYNTI
jgi:hypothetical protein